MRRLKKHCIVLSFASQIYNHLKISDVFQDIPYLKIPDINEGDVKIEYSSNYSVFDRKLGYHNVLRMNIIEVECINLIIMLFMTTSHQILFAFNSFIVSIKCLVSVPQQPDNMFNCGPTLWRRLAKRLPKFSGSPQSKDLLLFNSR